MGRKIFDTDDETVEETLEALGLNFPEIALLYRITLERDDSLSTVGKCKLKSVQQAASRITFESTAASSGTSLSNHAQLLGRTENNAHPISAITGLQDALDEKVNNFTLHPSMTGSITLNGNTNNTVNLATIVTTLGLEVGDVIRIYTGAYNKLHTVESITDNDSIIVNYEHAGNRGDGSLKLPDFTGTATVTRVAKWFNAPTGLGQAWVGMTSRRAIGTTYTNNTGRPIEVSTVIEDPNYGSNVNGSLFVDGILVGSFSLQATTGANQASTFTASSVVPSGSTYHVSGLGYSDRIGHWTELR